VKALSLVLCVADDGTIGKDGSLPWHLPEDLKHFKAVTKGHAIVMGRKTHASIGRPLPERRNIVVTRDRDYRAPGCEVVHSLDEALALAWSTDPEPCIIGGSSLYAEALPLATRIHLSRLHRNAGGDVFFPLESLSEFREVERRSAETPDLEFVTLERPS
jgi:dihydrofolate reductase